MSKTKMRCITCGKWFQSANAKEVTCPDCVQKARKEKMATKNASSSAVKPAGPAATAPVRPAPPKPKPVQGGGTNQWLDKLDDVKISQPEQPPQRPKPPTAPVQRNSPYSSDYAQRDNREWRDPQGNPRRPDSSFGSPYNRDTRGPARGPGAYRVNGPNDLTPGLGQRPRSTTEGEQGRPPFARGPYKPGPRGNNGNAGRPQPKDKSRTPKPPSPPKPPKEKTPPPAPFVPTEEQVTRVEERYLELAQPAEFDGIRTQIAHEIGIPKKAVKKIVKDLRSRQNILSWWEMQTYKGSEEEKEKIRAAYMPYLPVPPVGVHKLLAEQLALKPGTIYQAIKTIRQELNLPQYNDPELHAEELAQRAKQAQEQQGENSPQVSDESTAPPSSENTPTPAVEAGDQQAAESVAPTSENA